MTTTIQNGSIHKENGNQDNRVCWKTTLRIGIDAIFKQEQLNNQEQIENILAQLIQLKEKVTKQIITRTKQQIKEGQTSEKDDEKVAQMRFSQQLQEQMKISINRRLLWDEPGLDIFFQFVRQTEQRGLIQEVSIIYLFEELFESSLPDQLESNFDIFSNQIQTHGLKQTEQQYICVRMCKKIIRKLSESRDIQFKSKIHSLFSSILPLNHMSGLNITAKFSQQSEKIHIQTLEEILKEDSEVTNHQYRVYKNFWNLQKLIVNPKQICQQAGNQTKVDLEEMSDEETKDQKMEVDQPTDLRRADTIEEGQAEEGEDLGSSISDMHVLKRIYRKQNPSNFIAIMFMIESFLNMFQENPLETNKNTKIQVNYPKFLAKYQLMKLQFNDLIFRQTFIYQVLVFIDWIKNPVKGIPMIANIDESELKYVDIIQARSQHLLNQQTKREESPKSQKRNFSQTKDFDYKEAFKHSIDREQIWQKSKENTKQSMINKRQQGDQNNTSAPFNLTNFERKIDEDTLAKFTKKRDQKGYDKRKERPVVTKQSKINKFGNARQLFQTLMQPSEVYDTEDSSKTNIKQGSIKMLNEYLNPILQGMDPEEGVEDEYKKKNDQSFCWTFLRSVSYLEYNIRDGAKQVRIQHSGNIEEVANFIHQQAEKRPVDIKAAEQLEKAKTEAKKQEIAKAEAKMQEDKSKATTVEETQTPGAISSTANTTAEGGDQKMKNEQIETKN